MTIIYITLNNSNEARSIGKKILEAKLANCVNWFPITCMYRWEGKIAEIEVGRQRKEFLEWLDKEC